MIRVRGAGPRKSVAGPLDQEAELQAVARKKKRGGEEEENDPCSAPNNNGPLEQDQPTTTGPEEEEQRPLQRSSIHRPVWQARCGGPKQRGWPAVELPTIPTYGPVQETTSSHPRTPLDNLGKEESRRGLAGCGVAHYE